MLMLGDITFRISFEGSDPRQLGWRSTIILTGKNDVDTIIVRYYCPVHSTELGSTFVQQLLFMANNKGNLPDVDCPRQLFGIDLKNELETFISKDIV